MFLGLRDKLSSPQRMDFCLLGPQTNESLSRVEKLCRGISLVLMALKSRLTNLAPFLQQWNSRRKGLAEISSYHSSLIKEISRSNPLRKWKRNCLSAFKKTLLPTMLTRHSAILSRQLNFKRINQNPKLLRVFKIFPNQLATLSSKASATLKFKLLFSNPLLKWSFKWVQIWCPCLLQP